MTVNIAEPKTPAGPDNANDGTALHGAERAVEHAREALNTGVQSGQQAYERAKDAVGAGVHAAQQKIGATVEMAKEAAVNAGNSVADAAAYVGHRAEDATTSVGGALEDTGHYLKDDGLRHIASDVTQMIRRNPVPAMLIGIGLGFLIAQATKHRNV